MEQRALGTQGLEVSALGLGCMGMSTAYGTAEERDEREAIATIDSAAELGITMLDTADMYGPFTNELLVGKALTGRRDQYVVATKFGFEQLDDGTQRINGHPDYVHRACDASLQRLDIDVIDLYLPAPRRPLGADRGDGRSHGRARRRREGPVSRPERSGAGHDSPGSRGSSHLGGAIGVLTVRS